MGKWGNQGNVGE
jgi:hypothetical protein